ncbi:MAG TPA: hypothetical protein VHZ07_03975 [Bryobacteraceae bacterium]|jgi:hypothetical protein|nr:hypothetical protein [Bryobacteraceae bacterium]
MGQRLTALFVWGAFLLYAPLPVSGRSKQIDGIDQLCRDIVAEFPDGPSLVFSGPNPWTEIDAPPPEMTEGAWAYVYAEGPGIRWVFLREVGPGVSWLEDTNYFYREDGTLAKRQRNLSAFKSNINLDVTGYYDPDGKLLKEITRHHALAGKRENTSTFADHEPPLFPSTSDVPFSDDPSLIRRLANVHSDGQSPAQVLIVFRAS